MDQGFVPGDVKEIIVGPANDRPGAVKLGNNQSITQEEAEAFQAIQAAGYKVKFKLFQMYPSVIGMISNQNLVLKGSILTVLSLVN